MADTVGGPIESITLAGRRFDVDAENAANVDLGGFSNDVKQSGSGKNRLVKSRLPASIEGLNVVANSGENDHEYLQSLRNRMGFFDVSLTYCDGTVYAGSMQLTDDVKYDSNESTISITLKGSLERQG
jgi:hypothetical protein